MVALGMAAESPQPRNTVERRGLEADSPARSATPKTKPENRWSIVKKAIPLVWFVPENHR